MTRYSDSDPYIDPKCGVLRNRLGIIDEATLEKTEAALVSTRAYELSREPLKGTFDFAHLRAIHRYLFGDVYAWAGELRTVDINKGGSRFAHHTHLESAAAQIFRELGKERGLAGLGPAPFSERAAHYLGELNALHPFREGNGRTQREFISHLAHANGYYVAWEKMNPAALLKAMIQSFWGEGPELARLIRDNLEPLDDERLGKREAVPGWPKAEDHEPRMNPSTDKDFDL